jgi:PKD repeat protein
VGDLVLVPRPLGTVSDCRTLLQLIQDVDGRIAGLQKALADPGQPVSSLEPRRQDLRELNRWRSAALARVNSLCNPPAGGGAGPGGSGPGAGAGGGTGAGGNPGPDPPINAAPSATFGFSPSSPPAAPKAGQQVSFTGNAADSDGSVASWTFDFGDGATATGGPVPPQPQASHAYSQPGIYRARLTVIDDDSARFATDAQDVYVSGAGTKTDDVIVDCPDDTFTITDVVIKVYIPSYAEGPITHSVSNPCAPDAQQIISAQRTAGNPFGLTDEWGRPKDTYTITVRYTGAGSPSTGNVHTEVHWN